MQSENTVPIGLTQIGKTEAEYGWKAIWAAERALAGLLLILLSPVLVLCALVLAIRSGRSPLVAHQRAGQAGRPIWILKLRTMWTGERRSGSFFLEKLSTAYEQADGPKRRDDPRVSCRFAAFCRRYSIDELPQLWQVVTGDLTLVAPRPLTWRELETHYGPDARHVLSRKPGLSGLWQVSGRSRLTYKQRRRLDLFLIRKWSFPLYLRIVLVTLPRVLAGKDAW